MVDLMLPYAMRELREPSRHKAYYGGRGGAKSHSFAQELVIRGWERREMRWLCAREIQKSVSASVKTLLEDKIRLAKLGPREDGGNGFYKVTDTSISSADGRVEFLFMGLRTNPENIKSLEGLDGAWIEEADRVSQRSIDLLTPTIRKEGSELWWSWNRNNETDPVDKMFLGPDGPPPRSIVRKVCWYDNPWFPDVLREEMEWDKSRDMDKWLHVWEGEPVGHSEAKVFKNWTVADIDADVPEEAWNAPRLGADWGYSKDPAVLIEAYIFDRTLYFRREVYKVGCTIDDLPSLFAGTDKREVLRWGNRLGHKGLASVRRGHQIVSDSSRPDTIRYLKDRGFNIIGARKGAGSVEEGVEFLKSYDIVVHPDCVHTQDELTHYRYKEDPLTGEVLPILVDKDNHVIDSARYALENVRRSRKGRISICGGQTVPLVG